MSSGNLTLVRASSTQVTGISFIKNLNYSIYSITSDGIYNKKHQDFTLTQNSFSSKVHQCVFLIDKRIIDEFLQSNKVEV